MSRSLPDRASLEQLRKQAKDLLAQWRRGDASRIAPYGLETGKPSLSTAQLVIAREHGFDSWPKLRQALLDRAGAAKKLCQLALIDSITPLRQETVARLLHDHPSLATSDIYLACLCGEAAAVHRYLAQDPSLVNRAGGPAGREPILYVCFSGFLRSASDRQEAFHEIVRSLLEAGANPNAAYDWEGWPLSALYGAVAVAKDPAIAKMLRAAGANLNDGETCYHGVEEPGLAVLREVFEGADLKSRTHALFRKLDFEDIEGLTWLLDHGVEPTLIWEDGQVSSLHQAIRRGRSLETIRLLLDRGADPNAVDAHGRTPYADAMRVGRTEIAKLLAGFGARTSVDPQDEYLAAIAEGRRPAEIELDEDHMQAVSDAAWTGDYDRVVAFLDGGLPVDGVPGRQSPLHSASWIGRADIVQELIRRGAKLNEKDPQYLSTPIGWCCHGSVHAPMQGHVEVAKLLIQAGADIGTPDTEWPKEGDASEEVRETILRSRRR